MEETLQHEEATQCTGLSPAGPGNHHPDGNQTNHALTINLDPSDEAAQGYLILLVCAVAATVTCLNGGLFGITGITFSLAQNGQLPKRFGKEFKASTRGLTISAGIALLMANFFSLTTVASLGSATSLLVYMLVNVGALKLIHCGARRRLVIWASVASCAFAIFVWAVYTVYNNPSALVVFATFLALAVGIEVLLHRFSGRRILPVGG